MPKKIPGGGGGQRPPPSITLSPPPSISASALSAGAKNAPETAMGRKSAPVAATKLAASALQLSMDRRASTLGRSSPMTVA